MTKEVTIEEVEHWLGSDWKFSEILETMKDLANGEYCPKQMKSDIRETCLSTGFETMEEAE